MNKQEQGTVMSNENMTENRQCTEQDQTSYYQHASRRPWVRRVARTMAFLLAAQSALPALAQSALPISPSASAPAGQRPILDAANNGVPIVHVAPPSAAGVSRNQYEQFNVNPNGLILNNSTGNVQTQLGGWVTGNLQLGPTPARIILNEVVSAHTSTLRGTIEVAGRRADIVIANPNGITCDGCGFLNANRASLSTGLPQFGSGGAIQGFDVRQGQLTIGGNGLNASNLEQLDLIARGIVIEGEVWAQNLKLIAGANQVLYGTLEAASQSGSGMAPRFAIDIKNLGGMYANQVYMIATEQGLGVNSTGRMAALQGNLILSANGDLRLQDSYAKQNVQIAGSGNVTLAGQTQSEGNMSVAAVAHLDHRGVLDAGGRLRLDAASIGNTGTVAQRNAEGAALNATGQVTNSGTLYSAGRFEVNAAGIRDTNGTLLAAADVRLQAQSIELTGTAISTEGSALLAAGTGMTAQQSDIRVAGNLDVTAGAAVVNTDSTWQAAGNASVAGASFANHGSTVQTNGRLDVNVGGTVDNTAGKLLAGGNVGLQAQSLTNERGQIVSDAATSVRLAGPLKNGSGTISSKGNLQIAATNGAIDNKIGTLVSDAGLAISGANLANTGGVIASGGQQDGALTIRVAGLSNRDGTVDAAGVLELTSTGTVDNSNGILQSGTNAATQDGNTWIKSASLVNNGGRIVARDAMTVETGDLNNDLAGSQQGTIASLRGSTMVQAAQASNVGGLITAASDSTIRTRSLDNSGGEISAGALLSLDTDGNALTNNGGSLLAGSDIDIRAGAISSKGQSGVAGSITAARDISIQGTSFSNDNSIVSAGRSASITVGALSNNGGSIEAQGAISASAATVDNRSGQMTANEAVSVMAGSVDSTDGLIAAGDTVTVSATGALTNARGKIVSNGNVDLTAATLDNNAGTISARESRVLLGAGMLTNMQGLLIGSGTLAIESGEIRNDKGTIASGSALALDTRGQSLNNDGGQIVANNDLRVDSAKLTNDKGAIASIAGTLAVDTGEQELVNDGGKLQAQGDLTLDSGAFRNQGGLVSGQQITANTGSFDNRSGQVVASGNLDITSDTLGNDAGLLQAVGNVTVDTQGQSIINTNSGNGGGIVAGNELSIAAGSLNNKAGFVGSGGNQTLAVAGDIDNRAAGGQAGRLVTNASGKITAANLFNTGGRISTLGELAVTTGTLDNRAGQVTAGGATVFTVTTLDNSAQGAIDTDQLTATATSINNNGGAIRSTKDTAITAASLTNAAGTVSAKANLSMSATSLSNTGGTLVGDAGVDVTTSSNSPGGTIASANNVTLNVNGNYSNSGLLSAQKNLTVNAINITNSGTLAAGNVLTANTGNLTNSGEILANTTNLNVSGTLTNTATGLIDGVYTNINAAATDNTGRIYGDVLSIKGNAVNNSDTGTIAARNTLSIGVQYISNTNGSLIYSLGNLNMAGGLDANGNLVGQAQQLANRSARIEAAGNVNLAVANLYNLNDALSTRTVTTVEGINKTYIQPNGSVEKYDPAVLGWDAAYKEWSGRYVLPSSTYPFAQFGASKMRLSNCWGFSRFGCSSDTHNYPPEHLIWANFNVAPPYTADLVRPSMPPRDGTNRQGNCMRTGDDAGQILDGACGAYWQALEIYNNTIAERISVAERALDAKIKIFNADIDSRAFEAWNEYQLTNKTVSETVIDSTRPAQILAGGSIAINGSGTKLNDNSQIVAGGAIYIGGTSVINQAAEGSRSVTEQGQVRFRRIEHHGGFSDSYEVELHAWYPTTGASYVETFQLPGYSYAPYGGNQTATRNLNIQATAPLVAKSETALSASGQTRTISGATLNAALPNAAAAGKIVNTPPVIQKLDIAGSGTQAPSVILTTLPRMSAPSGSLFVHHPEPAARYLVETDPRFTNYRTFLSSDYFLQALNRDPERQLKRYGDGFYEQQLVNDQILALTGRRYLSGFSDTQAEYQALMDAGVAFARQYQLSPGVALTAEQMALLTTDIVWLTAQTVTLADGTTQQVLVPQVYLRRPQDGDLQQSGALIAGSDIQISTEEDLVNSGTIAADRSTTLAAGRDLVNQGGRISGQDILAYASNDLKNLSGVIKGVGENNQVALFAGRDIVLQTRTIASSTEASATTAASKRTSIDRIATVQGGDIRLEAARDLIAQGSQVDAQRNLLTSAGRDIKVTSVAGSYQLDIRTGGNTQGRTGYIKEENVTNNLATFDAGNDMALVAGTNEKGDVVFKGVNINAGNDVALQGDNVTIEAVKDSRMADVQNVGKKQYRRAMESDETVVGGTVSAGNNIKVRAVGEPGAPTDANGAPTSVAGSGDIRLAGATLNATNGEIAVVANNDVIVETMVAQDSTASEYYQKSKSWTSSTTVIDNRYTDSKEAQVTSINSANGAVTVTAGNDLILEGTQINAGKDATLYAGNQLLAVAAHDTRSETIDRQKWKTGVFTSPGLVPIRPETRGAGDGRTTVTSSAQGATITSAEGNVTLYGAEAVGLEGAGLTPTQGDVGIVGGVVDIRAATDISSITTTHTEKGAKINTFGWSDPSEGFGRKTSETSNIQQTTLARTTMDAENIRIAATAGGVHVAGTTITTPGTLTLEATSGTVAFDGQQTEITTSTEFSKKDLMYQKVKGQGGTEQVTEYNKINAGAIVVATPTITAQVGSKDSVAQLAAQPGMAWIDQIVNEPKANIDWRKIEDISSKWDYKAQGLTPEGAVIVTIVVAFLTWGTASGAGAAVEGATGSVVTGGATTAAVSTLATQAAIAVANNPGDPGAALKELGSSANVKGLIAAMITGGVLAGLNLSPTGEPTVSGGAQKFTAQLGQNLQAGVAKTLINTAVHGGSLEDNLKSSLVTAFIDTAAAQGAHAIGDMNLDSVANKIAHAMAGCVAGAAKAGSDGCSAGALGAAMGEIAAEGYGVREDTVQFAGMISGIAAAVAGLDAEQINVASQLGANAAANNFLKHPENQLRKKAIEGCVNGVEQDCVIAKKWDQIDKDRDAKLRAACLEAPASQACQNWIAFAKASERSYGSQIGGSAAVLDEIKYGNASDIAERNSIRSLINTTPHAHSLNSEAMKIVADIALDVTPVVGDIKGFVEAETPFDYAIAAIGSLGPAGDAAKILVKEAKALMDAGDTVKALEKLGEAKAELKTTTAAKGSPVDYDHIIGADYTKKGKPSGGHSLINGDVRIVPGTESATDSAGVYQATIQVPDPKNPGQWLTKTSYNFTNTMFPKAWDEARIKAEVDAAWNSPSKIVTGDKWTSTTPSGVKVEGFTAPRVTVYPVYQGTKKL